MEVFEKMVTVTQSTESDYDNDWYLKNDFNPKADRILG